MRADKVLHIVALHIDEVYLLFFQRVLPVRLREQFGDDFQLADDALFIEDIVLNVEHEHAAQHVVYPRHGVVQLAVFLDDIHHDGIEQYVYQKDHPRQHEHTRALHPEVLSVAYLPPYREPHGRIYRKIDIDVDERDDGESRVKVREIERIASVHIARDEYVELREDQLERLVCEVLRRICRYRAEQHTFDGDVEHKEYRAAEHREHREKYQRRFPARARRARQRQQEHGEIARRDPARSAQRKIPPACHATGKQPARDEQFRHKYIFVDLERAHVTSPPPAR